MTNHLLVSSENEKTRTTLNKTLAGELKEYRVSQKNCSTFD